MCENQYEQIIDFYTRLVKMICWCLQKKKICRENEIDPVEEVEKLKVELKSGEGKKQPMR